MKLKCTTKTGIFYGTKCDTFISAMTGKQMVSLNIYLQRADNGQWIWSRQSTNFTVDQVEEIEEFPN